ncbi:MAG: transglutaminase-like domain-containing protein [Myxococcota bacterium]
MRNALLLALVLASVEGKDRTKPLHVFDVVSADGTRLDGPRMPRVVLVLQKAGIPLEVLKRSPAPTVNENLVVIDDVRLLRATDPPGEAHRRPSFVIDYDEKSFAPVAQAAASAGKQPNALRQMVRGYITNKSGQRGFDPASVVAVRKEGDCTEHAVLLAAAARSVGLPARVVLGIVLVQGKKTVGGIGHAWTEIHDGTGWQVVDAALPDDPTPRVYVPFSVMTDEGPGFRLTGVAALHVRQVRLEPRP